MADITRSYRSSPVPPCARLAKEREALGLLGGLLHKPTQPLPNCPLNVAIRNATAAEIIQMAGDSEQKRRALVTRQPSGCSVYDRMLIAT